MTSDWFASPADARDRLAAQGYLADTATTTTSYLAGALEKPLLVEGPAGVGKTELAKAVARATGADLVRLQCYEGLDEARALYEWNYKKQLLRIQAAGRPGVGGDPRRHLHRRVPAHPPAADRDPARGAHGAARRRGRQDRRRGRGAAAGDPQRLPGHHPRAGHARRRTPAVRRAHLERDAASCPRRSSGDASTCTSTTPTPSASARSSAARCPTSTSASPRQVVDTVGRLRELELKKAPSIAESVDWARTLVALEIGDLDERAVSDTLGVVLKHASDQERAVKELRLPPMTSGLLTSTSPSSRRCAAPAYRSRSPRTSTRSRRSASLDWGDRDAMREGYAAAVVKRQAQRPTFDALFDLYFPRLVGDGWRVGATTAGGRGPARRGEPAGCATTRRRSTTSASGSRPRWPRATSSSCPRLATEAVGRFGAMRGRGPGLSSWSAYTTLQRVSPQTLVDQVVAALLAEGRADDEARRAAGRRVGRFSALVEADARRRIARGEGPRPRGPRRGAAQLDRLDFTASAQGRPGADAPRDLPAGTPAGDPADAEHHAQRRGPLDFRRTVRASVSTGGVPLTTHHQPEAPAPHRAGRALRRQRVGGELRPVHAAAGLRAARAVRQGPGLHLRRPGARGHPRTSAPAPTWST